VLTAAHVVEDGGSISIGLETGQIYPAKVLYAEGVGDLAVLETIPVFLSVARMAPLDTGYRFHKVLCYGFPALVGPDGHPTFGMVASERDEKTICVKHGEDGQCLATQKVPFWRVTAPTFFGNSGGAVYVRDEGGWALIGVSQRVVVTSWGAVAAHVGFCSPPAATRSTIRAALYVMEESRRGAK
jgi:S1-C subfamily serine protease